MVKKKDSKKKISQKVSQRVVINIGKGSAKGTRRKATTKVVPKELPRAGGYAPFSTIVQYETKPVRGDDLKSQLGDFKNLLSLMKNLEPFRIEGSKPESSVKMEELPREVKPPEGLPAPTVYEALPPPPVFKAIEGETSAFKPLSPMSPVIELGIPKTTKSMADILRKQEEDKKAMEEAERIAKEEEAKEKEIKIKPIEPTPAKTVSSETIENFIDVKIDEYTNKDDVKKLIRSKLVGEGKRGLKGLRNLLSDEYGAMFTQKGLLPSDTNEIVRIFKEQGANKIFNKLLNIEEPTIEKMVEKAKKKKKP